MSTKAGVHITTGSRNGYGEVAAAIPAAVLTDHDAGALAEAKGFGGDRVITIYRDTSFYSNNDGPSGIGEMTEAEARAEADARWPTILASCRSNQADYYQLSNEIGGGLEKPTKAIIAYEMRLMELAEAEGLYLLVGNQAGGTPGDFELWERLFVPLLRRAEKGGHLYSRHAYGGVQPGSSGFLTTTAGDPADDNAGRPFREALYLKEKGIQTPMVITEAGQYGGHEFAGVEPFIEDVRRYDALCRAHANIWAFCLWTYGDWWNDKSGDWRNPNIEVSSDELAAYLRQQGGAERQEYPAIEETIEETETEMDDDEGESELPTDWEAPSPPLVTGWIWAERVERSGELGQVHSDNLVLRERAHSESTDLGLVPVGTVVRITGPEQAGDFVYYPVEVSRAAVDGGDTTGPVPDDRQRSGASLAGNVRFGMNINPDATHGNPVDSGSLRGMGWVRFPFKLSARPNPAERGDLNAAFAQYDPLVRRYAEQGINCLFILNQETVAGDVPWEFKLDNGTIHAYSDARSEWEDYATRFASVAASIAAHYRDLGLGQRVAFQIWNEGDLQHNDASIYLKPEHMAIVLKRAEEAIHRELPDATLIFNGMATGADKAVTYLQQCRQALGGRLPVSAIGIHPYGSYVSEPPFPGWGFGLLADGLDVYRQHFPDMRFWITEIGVAEDVELGPEHYRAIANYKREVCRHVARDHSDLIDVLIWFAWSDEMRNAGMVNRNGQPKQHVYSVFEKVRDRTLI